MIITRDLNLTSGVRVRGGHLCPSLCEGEEAAAMGPDSRGGCEGISPYWGRGETSPLQKDNDSMSERELHRRYDGMGRLPPSRDNPETTELNS